MLYIEVSPVKDGWHKAEVTPKNPLYGDFYMLWHNMEELWADIPAAVKVWCEATNIPLPDAVCITYKRQQEIKL